ncbi:MAG: CoB--CoM heterodisulfide reductase iron-sulfur subunit B family protein [Chloroflexi bacterium]|nr:CoB--CoM heterodisulfide reductase iron-sulfur subunit B family protein [Chloroflexota bacterium]
MSQSNPTAARETYSYFPGCTLHSTAREYDVSARLACRALGIELKELEDWACCGASSAHSTNDLLAISLPTRDLGRAARSGLPLVAACAMCFSRLKTASIALGDPEKRQQVGEVLGEEVTGAPKVLHLLEVIDRRLDSLPVARPLAGLKVACYYGCLLVRPRHTVAIDDAEDPQVMDRLIKKLGAEAVAWPFKTECCGAGMPLARPDMVLRLSHRIFSQARQAGAECLAVACPECHSNLDLHQQRMAAVYPDHVKMPVLYFTQLLGLALGRTARELHMDRHLTDTMPLLVSKGLA